jgi:hypothetical protein
VTANAAVTTANACVAERAPGPGLRLKYTVPKAATPIVPAAWRHVVKTPLMSAA